LIEIKVSPVVRVHAHIIMDDMRTEQLSKATPYFLMGGEAALRRLIDRFYDIMDRDAEFAGIRAMHAPDLGPMRASLFEFMSGWLGGPRLYNKCMMSAHAPFAIGPAERDQWIACMDRALQEAEIDPKVRKMVEQPLRIMADAVRNR
jgi:hemoglobin